MSQVQNFSSGGAPGTPNIEFVVGNDAVPVGPNPATHAIDIIGDSTKGVSVLNTAPFTEKVSVAFATTASPGVASFNPADFTVAAGVVSSIASGDLHAARFIVSAGGSADGANYTTLPAAYAAAVAATGNQTIFLQPGTYNIGTMALSPGINISAFDCDALTPSVVINGKMTANITGDCAFSGISFLNNSDNVLAISGSGASTFQFTECFINVSGTATAIVNSNPSAGVRIFSSKGDISGTDTYFNFTAGGVILQDSFMFNNIESLTANIFDNASIDLESSTFDCPIVATNTGGDVSIKHSTMIVLNGTCVTTSGGPNADLVIYNSHIDSNNATAISIGAGSTMTIANTSVGSNATNAIDGAGILLYAPIAFTKSSSQVTTATQTPLRFGPQISPELADTNGTVYYDGTILKTNSPGTTGQVWTSNGAGTPPSFQTSGSPPLIAFRAHLNANTATNLTGDGTLVTVPFDTVDYDIGSGYNNSTFIYTVPVGGAGIYQINYTVFTYRGSGVNTVQLLNLLINGATNIRNYEVNFENMQTSGELTLTSGMQYQLNDGDTIQVTADVGGVSANIGFAGTFCVFSATRLG